MSPELIFCKLCAEIEPTGELVDMCRVEVSSLFINNTFKTRHIPEKICTSCVISLQYCCEFTTRIQRIQKLLLHLQESGRSLTKNNLQWIKQKIDLKTSENNLLEQTKILHSTEEVANTPQTSKKNSIITNNSFIRFKCNNCEAEMQNWCALGNHTVRQHGEKPKVLCLCNKYLHTRAAINRHIAKHDTNAHISCPKCGKICLSQKYLQAHILSHNTDEQRGYSCDKCDRRFQLIRNLKAHMKTHLPDLEKYHLTCSICNKKFTAKSVLKNHISTIHEKQKLYVCDICGLRFAHKGNMAYHITSHGDIFAYSCTQCSKRFKNKAKLVRHRHTHSDSAHACPVCSKLLRSRRTLQVHLFTHRRQNLFTCHICHKSYKKSLSLEQHLQRHTFSDAKVEVSRNCGEITSHQYITP